MNKEEGHISSVKEWLAEEDYRRRLKRDRKKFGRSVQNSIQNMYINDETVQAGIFTKRYKVMKVTRRAIITPLDREDRVIHWDKRYNRWVLQWTFTLRNGRYAN